MIDFTKSLFSAQNPGQIEPIVSLWGAWPIRQTLTVACTTTGNLQDSFVKGPGETSMYYGYGPWHCHVSAPHLGHCMDWRSYQKKKTLVWQKQFGTTCLLSRLAVRLGYTTVTLVSDSEVAIAQLLKVRAKSVLSAQQSVLRGLARRLVCFGLVVRVLWVPSGFQPADPMSRLQGDFGGDGFKAKRMVGLVYEQLLCSRDKVQYRGVLCLGKGTDSSVV